MPRKTDAFFARIGRFIGRNEIPEWIETFVVIPRIFLFYFFVSFPTTGRKFNYLFKNKFIDTFLVDLV